MPRLTSGLWVSAYLTRLRIEAIPAYVVRKGDATAGAVMVKLATMNGQAELWGRQFDFASDKTVWEMIGSGQERDIDADLTRATGRDPDLWILEVEDPKGRTLLDQDGL